MHDAPAADADRSRPRLLLGSGVMTRAVSGAVAGTSLLLAAAGCSMNVHAAEPMALAAAPPTGTLGLAPPRLDDRTVVLFGGTSFDGWRQRNGQSSQWIAQDDGSVLVRGGDAISEVEAKDFQLHVEFRCPEMPEKAGQARANSGVYLHGRYEVQVLDTHGQPPAMNGCGALYSIAPPLVNAARPAGQWQSYDIAFRAPRFGGDGAVIENPRVTVIHNGVVIHNNLELPRTTPGGIDERMVPSGPVLLQDHGDPLRYRNMWLRHLN